MNVKNEKEKEVGRANVCSRCSISGNRCFLYADINRKLPCASLHKTDELSWEKEKDFPSRKSLSFPAARTSGIDFLSKFEWHLSSLHSGKSAGAQVIYCLGCHKRLLCSSGSAEHAGRRVFGQKKRKGNTWWRDFNAVWSLFQCSVQLKGHADGTPPINATVFIYTHTHVLENLYNDNKLNVYKSKCVHFIIRFLFTVNIKYPSKEFKADETLKAKRLCSSFMTKFSVTLWNACRLPLEVKKLQRTTYLVRPQTSLWFLHKVYNTTGPWSKAH